MKKLVFDIAYDENKNTANTAAVEFIDYSDTVETQVYTDISDIACEYIPGQFYKRELPAIMHLLENKIGFDKLKAEYDTIIVDGLYMLGQDHLGLGAHLANTLKEKYDIDIEVIGIAKTYFDRCETVSKAVYRGETAKTALYVNGNKHNDYTDTIKSMYGKYKLPYMVKRVDTLCRDLRKGV